MKITIDGAEIEIAGERTILQALDDAGLLMDGVDIPHYCWHPKLSIDGSCRLCQVEIEGMPKLQIACNTPVSDGMVVHTRNERVRKAREAVMELLLVNHPLDCAICDQAGECKLQDYAFDYGHVTARTREPRCALKKNTPLGPTIVFDQERCILCRRCVRFCSEVTGTRELGVFNRGDASVIDTVPGFPLDNPYSMNVADVCPVGALTTRDFRFKVRVWFLDEREGICTGCSRGCNVHVGVANNKVQRYVPRRNDAVNDTWMCDEGRLSYRDIGAAHRIRQALVRRDDGVLEPTGYDAAVDAAARLLRHVLDEKGAEAVAGVASAHATNEDLATFRAFLKQLGVARSGVPVLRGESDDILRCEEKAANPAGARALGFDDASGVVEAVRGGEVSAIVMLGHDLLDERYLGGAAGLSGVDALIVLDVEQSDLHRVAHVILPTRHAAEKTGTLTNFAGRVQRVLPMVEPAWEAYAEGHVLARIGGALGLPGFEGGGYDVCEVSRRLADSDAAFAGIHVDSVGAGGLLLAGARDGRVG